MNQSKNADVKEGAGRYKRTLRNLCGVALMVMMAMMLTSCEQDPNEVADPAISGMESTYSDATGANDIGVTVDELNNQPDIYLDASKLMVSGELNDLYEPRLFTIGGDNWFGGEILVAATEPVPLLADRDENEPLLIGDLIMATGTLEKFVVADVEREIGAEVPPDLEVEFEEKYVFVATSVDITPRIDAVKVGAATPSTGNSVEVDLSEFAITMPDTLPAGPTTFMISNTGDVKHNFEIEGQGIEKKLSMNLKSGESKTLKVDLEPGTYTVYCPVGEHADKGMKMQLVVSG